MLSLYTKLFGCINNSPLCKKAVARVNIFIANFPRSLIRRELFPFCFILNKATESQAGQISWNSVFIKDVNVDF